jgi:hypothetical protein
MGQEDNKAFKSYCTINVYRCVTQAMDTGAFDTLMAFCKAFNIKDCNLIKMSCHEVKGPTMNACWH